jgi:hypothetical protein
MKRICVPIGCRSDEGLSAPVIKRLKEHFIVDVVHLTPQDWVAAHITMECAIHMYKPDLVFITGDRVEMCAAAAAAFHNKVKIAHFYAGIVNDPITTFDDIDRHCITLWSDIVFCENEDAVYRSRLLMGSVGRANLPVHNVGISHLDDLEVDESRVPGEPYDLLLLNAEPLSEPHSYDGPDAEHLTIHIGSNPDKAIPALKNAIYYPNIPRPQFLGLLKNCQRFITNSSAAIYEAPHFLKPEQIIMVGDRNRNRPKGPFKTGASDRIVEILKILKEYLK